MSPLKEMFLASQAVAFGLALTRGELFSVVHVVAQAEPGGLVERLDFRQVGRLGQVADVVHASIQAPVTGLPTSWAGLAAPGVTYPWL